MAFTVDEHIRLKRVSSIAASPDGSWLAVAVERVDRDGAKYASDLWRVPTDGSTPLQLTRGDTRDTSPAFRYDGALGFLSNRQPNEIEPDEDAEKRMQVWVLPAGGGEGQQVTDEPLGLESFRFARDADRLVLFAWRMRSNARRRQGGRRKARVPGVIRSNPCGTGTTGSMTTTIWRPRT